MATRILFQDCTDETTLECFANINNQIYFAIQHENFDFPAIVLLDKSTAIKLSKTLKTEISKIK